MASGTILFHDMVQILHRTVKGASKTIFVGNISWTTTDSQLLEFCSRAGRVQSAEVKRFSDTLRSKGWG